MAITVKEVLDRKLFNGMKAVAGLAGLQAVITWVNIMEIPDSPDTINRGEFLITTGYGLENEEKYQPDPAAESPRSPCRRRPDRILCERDPGLSDPVGG